MLVCRSPENPDEQRVEVDTLKHTSTHTNLEVCRLIFLLLFFFDGETHTSTHLNKRGVFNITQSQQEESPIDTLTHLNPDL